MTETEVVAEELDLLNYIADEAEEATRMEPVPDELFAPEKPKYQQVVLPLTQMTKPDVLGRLHDFYVQGYELMEHRFLMLDPDAGHMFSYMFRLRE